MIIQLAAFQCLAEELNPVLQFRRLPCCPAHPQGIAIKYPDQESNLILQFRTLPCSSGTPARRFVVAISRPGFEPGPGPSEGPMQIRYTIGIQILKSRRLDSHQHQPVYKTGAFLFRATSASTSARSRTPSVSFGD